MVKIPSYIALAAMPEVGQGNIAYPVHQQLGEWPLQLSLSNDDSMLESCLFVSKGGGAELVDCQILSTFSSKEAANSSAEYSESILAHLSPVRIPSDFQSWCGLDCSDTTRSLQYFDFVVLNSWWDSRSEVSHACRLPSVCSLPLVLYRHSKHRGSS